MSVHVSDFNSMDSTILDAKDMSKIKWKHPDKSPYKCCQALNVRFILRHPVHVESKINHTFIDNTMGGNAFCAKLQ